MSKRTFVVEERSSTRTGWLVILMAAVLIVFWKVLLITAAIAVAIWLSIKYAKWQIAHNDAKALELEEIAMRADEEHMRYLSEGDIYGQYQPTTMPMEPVEWYDYDSTKR